MHGCSGCGGPRRRRCSIAGRRRCGWLVCPADRSETAAASPSAALKVSGASIASASSSTATTARDGRKGNMCSVPYPGRRMDLVARSTERRRHPEAPAVAGNPVLNGCNGSCSARLRAWCVNAAAGAEHRSVRTRDFAQRRKRVSGLPSSAGLSTSCHGRCRGRTGRLAYSRNILRMIRSWGGAPSAAMRSTRRACCSSITAASIASATRSVARTTCSPGHALAAAGGDRWAPGEGALRPERHGRARGQMRRRRSARASRRLPAPSGCVDARSQALLRWRGRRPPARAPSARPRAGR